MSAYLPFSPEERLPAQLIKRLKFDFNTLKKINPKLILASITPYGQTGPYRNWKGYDINCCALGGITNAMGSPDREPLTCPLFQGDYQAGISAAIAIMIALFSRDISGKGTHIDISEAECWATFHIGMAAQDFIAEGRVRKRSGHRAFHRPYLDEVLPCKDGYICFDTPQNRQWHRFLEVLGNPEWANDPIFKDRIKTTDEFGDKADDYLSDWLKQHNKEEIFKLFQDNRVPVAPIKTIAEIVNDAHLKKRGYFVEIDHPSAGTLKYPGVGYKFSKTPFTVRYPAPCLGEHNEEVYGGRLGYSKTELVTLRRAGVI
ncbi:CaiB/BaiF CoA transferase family protein [Chloroflexota bacterium]